jgi:group I intron endonuclease
MDKVKMNMNLSNLFNPGLYKITCTVNQKQYIGESSNIFNRLGRHTDSLENNRSDCLEMQRDFNQYSKNNFIFTAFEIDSKYGNKDIRKERETFLIQQIPEELRYNQLEPPEYSTSRRIQIRGQIYPSLSNASQVLNESRTNIFRKALNPEILDYVLFIQEENEENSVFNLQQEYKFHKSFSCIIDGRSYKSLNQAAKDLGIHHKTVKNRILSDKWPTYLSG